MNGGTARRTFFEYLGVADQERVHTQMLAWLLDRRHSPLSSSDRQKLLASAFSFEVDTSHLDRLEVLPELEAIDLVVIAPAGLLAIENKLKSRQSEGQLASYSTTLRKLALKRTLPLNRIQGRFLTFGGEPAKTDGWANVDYAQLLEALTPFADRNHYVGDYVAVLSKLISFRNEFLARHHLYPAIFRRSGMSSRDRLDNMVSESEATIVQFVCSNRLERIFCEALLRYCAERLRPGIHYVDESRGEALIDTRLFTLDFVGQSTQYRAGLQLQGSTVKLNIGSKSYAKSTRAEIASFEAKLDISVRTALASSTSHGQLKQNPSRAKAYRSWSYQLGVDETLQKITIDDFIAQHNERLAWATTTWAAALKELKQSGIVAHFAPATPETAGGEVVVE